MGREYLQVSFLSRGDYAALKIPRNFDDYFPRPRSSPADSTKYFARTKSPVKLPLRARTSRCASAVQEVHHVNWSKKPHSCSPLRQTSLGSHESTDTDRERIYGLYTNSAFFSSACPKPIQILPQLNLSQFPRMESFTQTDEAFTQTEIPFIFNESSVTETSLTASGCSSKQPANHKNNEFEYNASEGSESQPTKELVTDCMKKKLAVLGTDKSDNITISEVSEMPSQQQSLSNWVGGARALRDSHVRLVVRQLKHIERLNHALDRVSSMGRRNRGP